MRDSKEKGGLQLSTEEKLLMIFGTGLALASLKADDRWVVIPMLLVASVSFIVLCVLHQGKPLTRTFTALSLVCVITFIGWRDLRKGSTAATQGTMQKKVIRQTATDSRCSNVVAGRDANINCDSSEKKHDPDDHAPKP
jgi:hypothetical protein